MSNEIFISGIIGEDVTAKEIQKQLRNCEGTPIVRINSVGGNLSDGIAIVNAVKDSGAITVNEGIAYSMGAIILLAGKEVHAQENSLMMLHNVSGFAFGHSQQLSTTASDLKKHDIALAKTIAQKTGLENKTVFEQFLNYKDNFFNADEAKELGLVDKVIESEKKDEFLNLVQNMTFQNALNYFKGLGKNAKNEGLFSLNNPTVQGWQNLAKDDFEAKFEFLKEHQINDAGKWQEVANHFYKKMNEYGKQPACFHSNPQSTNLSHEGESHEYKTGIDKTFSDFQNL